MRDPIKNPVGNNIDGQRKRQPPVSVRKEIRDASFQTKRLCRVGVSTDTDVVPMDTNMIIEDERSVLEAQTFSAVEELKLAVAFQGEGAVQRKVNALSELRRLLSTSKFSPVEVALRSGAIPLVTHCLSKGPHHEVLHEAALCLKSIAVGKPEETRAWFPALPLLIAYIGENSSLHVPEQVACASVLGRVANEHEELRDILISQGALLPLAKMMLPNKGLIARTAAWALSSLIKGPDPKAATELIKIDGVVDSILTHMRESEDRIAIDVAWVVVRLSALSTIATSVLVKTDLLQLLVERLASSNCLHLLGPVLKSLGNLIAADTYTMNAILVVGHEITDKIIRALSRRLESGYHVITKEAVVVLSNIAASSVGHKQLIYKSAALPILLELLSISPFDIKMQAAYAVRNICYAPAEGSGRPSLISDHLVSVVRGGCLGGFIDLVRSSDVEAARLGLQFMEMVIRGMPNGEGKQLVEKEDGIDAMKRFQFHENDDLRNMANYLVGMYFREDYELNH